MDTATDEDRALARAAVQQLHEALDAHLAAIEKFGAGSTEVLAAFDDLARAAQGYDDAFYDVYDEVAPWDLDDTEEDELEEVEDELEVVDLSGSERPVVARVSVRSRSDFEVVDVDALLGVARAVSSDAGVEQPEDMVEALYTLLHAAGPPHGALLASGVRPAGAYTEISSTERTMSDDPAFLEDAGTFEAFAPSLDREVLLSFSEFYV